MAGTPISMTISEVQDYANRLRKLADACDVAITQMQAASLNEIYVSGKPTSEQCYDRIHSFVNNVIGEAFNPSPRPSSNVDDKLAQAAAIARATTSKTKKKGR